MTSIYHKGFCSTVKPFHFTNKGPFTNDVTQEGRGLGLSKVDKGGGGVSKVDVTHLSNLRSIYSIAKKYTIHYIQYSEATKDLALG